MGTDHLQKLLEVVTSDEWQYFIDSEIKEYKESLEKNAIYSCTTLESLYTTKGILRNLNWILSLEDSVKMQLDQEENNNG